MMKHLQLFSVIILSAVVAASAYAQKGRSRLGRSAANATETPSQKLYTAMLPATAKVMFIDSLVVGKEEFLSAIPLPLSAGRLSARRSADGSALLGQYENELADRRLYAEGDTVGTRLFSRVLLGEGWSRPDALRGADTTDYPFQNFPFLCADGVTLFFSAQGGNSMGGYDIFMTTYNGDKGEWYEPQNYGLPYNSAANDYLLAIDDLDSLGWLVSDRYQSRDSVCIYTFVPTYPRRDFEGDDISTARLKAYAGLTAIRDTWKFGNRQQALARRQTIMSKPGDIQTPKGKGLVINDRRVARRLEDLSKEASRSLYKQLQELYAMAQTTKEQLDKRRQAYAKAGTEDKKSCSVEILQLEKDLVQQNADIRLLEKKIRKIESMP